MFYLSFYPRCLAPHAMNTLQMLVEWNKFKFYILKFCYFSWSTSMQHHRETLPDLDGPTYYLFPVLSWCVFNKLCCSSWFLLCYSIIMAMCLYTITWTESSVRSRQSLFSTTPHHCSTATKPPIFSVIKSPLCLSISCGCSRPFTTPML